MVCFQEPVVHSNVKRSSPCRCPVTSKRDVRLQEARCPEDPDTQMGRVHVDVLSNAPHEMSRDTRCPETREVRLHTHIWEVRLPHTPDEARWVNNPTDRMSHDQIAAIYSDRMGQQSYMTKNFDRMSTWLNTWLKHICKIDSNKSYIFIYVCSAL